MSDQLFMALDNCLKMMDQGSDLESCLARYPELAAELRPLLLTAMDAASIAKNDIPIEVIRRGKANFLNAAAEIREQKASKKGLVSPPFKRIFRFSFAALVVLVLMAGIGGTGLVSAASGSLPGDQLYPVKLTWENIQLKLAIAQPEQVALEERFDQERVKEIHDLINIKRSEEVKFYGEVQGMFPGQIIVSSVTVAITPNTRIDGIIQINTWVRVEGETQPDGLVVANRIKVESPLPDNDGLKKEDDSGSSSGGDDSNNSSGKSGGDGSVKTKSPEIDQTETPESGSEDKSDSQGSNSGKGQSTSNPQSFEIEGIVTGYNGSLIQVAGKSIFIVPETELRGSPSEGSRVVIRGYINQDGSLIARRVEVKSSSGSGGGDNQGGGGDSGGSEDEHDNGPTKIPKPDD
jgi:hypothetical protein